MDMPPATSPPSLLLLARVNVVAHVAGLALAAIGLTPCSPLLPLTERMAYLSAAPALWSLCWVAWMLCALLLVGFLHAVVRRLGDDAELARVGLTLAIAALLIDLSCDAIFMVVLPMIASWRPPETQLFLTVERLTGLVSLGVANGAYSVAILCVSRVMQDRAGIGIGTVLAGYASGVCGLLLAGAGFTGVPWHAAAATPPTIVFYCIWVVLTARSLDRGGAR